jgi:large subunit ribosomal protein L16
MFQPQPRYFRKPNRHAIRTTYEQKSNRLRFGRYGLQALEPGFLTARQLESLRRGLAQRLKRKGKLWLRALPDYPRTAKPKEVRRGRGKGAVDHWVCILKPGRILLEAAAAPRELPRLQAALSFALRKLPVRAQLVERQLD